MAESNDERELAELLHSKLCRSNHADQCDWMYRKWEDEQIGYARKQRLEQARRLLSVVNFKIARQVVTAL
jgi:hypothetical protein